MKKFFTIQIAVLFQLAQLHAATTDAWMTSNQTLTRNSLGSLSHIFNKKMKMSEFLKSISEKAPKGLAEFSQEQLSKLGHANETVEIHQISGTKLSLNIKGHEATLEALDAIKGSFALNSHEAVFSFQTKSFESIHEQALGLLTKAGKAHKTAFLMDLFLPKAHAELETWEIAALGIGAVALIGYLWNNSNCNKYNNYANSCSFNGSSPVYAGGNTTGFLNGYHDLNNSWGPAWGCSADRNYADACYAATRAAVNQGGLSTTATSLVYPQSAAQIRTYQAPVYTPVAKPAVRPGSVLGGASSGVK